MRLYKLTDAAGQTRGGCQWGENITHRAAVGEMELCYKTVIHAYQTPLLAVLLNRIHANFNAATMRLWEATTRSRKVLNDGLKIGVRTLTTVREIALPAVTTEQRVRFAIRCALHGYHAPEFVDWADRWLSGEDRSAEVAKEAARSAAQAEAAKEAAWSAAWSAAQAEAAEWTARAAARAAAAAGAVRARAALPDFAAFAEWAVSDEPLVRSYRND